MIIHLHCEHCNLPQRKKYVPNLRPQGQHMRVVGCTESAYPRAAIFASITAKGCAVQ